MRAAIGADRGRLVRQMLTESVALSLLGAAGGLLLAFWATRALTVLAADRHSARRSDRHRSAACWCSRWPRRSSRASSFGLLPALHLSRQDLNDALKEGGRQQGAAIGRGARELLIVAEVALSIVLLVGAGLLVRSLWQLQHVDPGFTAEKVLAMEVSLPTARYEEGEQMPFYQRLEERVARASPASPQVGAINILPLSNNYDSQGVQVEDHPMPEGQGYAPQVRSITPGYFRAMGIPLITRPRSSTRTTSTSGQLVVIVSESMARKYWPGETDVIGKRITFNSGIPRERQQVVGGPGSRVVVGVVGDVKHLGLDEGEVPMFYTPHTQQPSYHTMRLVVRADADAAALTRQVRAELTQMDREVPLSQVATLSRRSMRRWPRRACARRCSGCSRRWRWSLAAIGVYGVVAYIVGQRTQEIGVRRALGARAADVMAMLLREAMRPVAIGIVIGVAGAFAMTRAAGGDAVRGVGDRRHDLRRSACGACSRAVAGACVARRSIPGRGRALGVDPITAASRRSSEPPRWLPCTDQAR